LHFVAPNGVTFLPFVDIAVQHIGHRTADFLEYRMPMRFTRAMRASIRAKTLQHTAIVTDFDMTGGRSGAYCLHRWSVARL
jgi:hypothetical protein